MRKADTKRARAEARQILADFGVRTAPVPVERIIKSRNIVLQYAPLDAELSGMAFIRDGIGIIGVNALHHPNRQRFSAAHELAHHVLHVSEISNEVHLDKSFRVLWRDDQTSLGVDPLEIEANAFASELLMPAAILQDLVDPAGLDLEDDDMVETLAKKLRVSTAALRYRLASRE